MQQPTRYNLVQGFRGGIMQEAQDGKYCLYHAWVVAANAHKQRTQELLQHIEDLEQELRETRERN